MVALTAPARELESRPGDNIRPRRHGASNALNLLPLAERSGHERTCCWIDPVENEPYRTSGERVPVMRLTAAGLLSRDTARHLQQSRTKARLSVYVIRYLLDEFHQIL